MCRYHRPVDAQSHPTAGAQREPDASPAGWVTRLVNDGALTLMVAVGHRTGLFDILDGLPPSTSAEIAAAAGLRERYVREWLGAMACGGVVSYDAESERYHLPAAYSDVLTARAGVGNAAAMAAVITMLAKAEDRIVECFQQGGGTTYDDYPGLAATIAERSSGFFDLALIRAVLPLVDGLTERLERGIDVLDVGCGTGHAVNLMAHRYPNSRFTGYDVIGDAVEAAGAEAAAMGLDNTTFDVHDAAGLDVDSVFDLVTTFSAIHDQAFPRRVLAGIARALRPGGVYLCADVGYSSLLEENLDSPFATYAYAASTMLCMPVSLGAGGEGLGEAWAGPQALALLAEAGFTDVVRHRPAWHQEFDYYVCRTRP